MKKTYLITLVILLVFAAGIITTGCVQGSDNSQGQQSGNTAPSVQGTGQPGTPAGEAGSYSGQYHNRTMGNGTRPQLDLASAAAKLGVTVQQLSDALSFGNTTAGQHGNITDAAQNLGVTEQQIRDALGIPAGGRARSGGYNATQTPGQ